MDYMRQQRLLEELDVVSPDVATAMRSVQLTSEQMGKAEEMLANFRKQEAGQNALLKDIQRQRQEYQQDAQYLARMHAAHGVSLELLSPAVRGMIHELAATASSLGLRTCDEEVVCTAYAARNLERLTRQRHKMDFECAEAELRDALEELQKHSKALRDRLAAAQEAQGKDLQQRPMQEQAIALAKSKAAAYQADIATSERKLELLRFTEEVSHSALVARSHELSSLEQELAEVQQQLEAYAGLPHTLGGLRALVERTSEQLAADKRTLNKLMTAGSYY